jgi:hypothetical protein
MTGNRARLILAGVRQATRWPRVRLRIYAMAGALLALVVAAGVLASVSVSATSASNGSPSAYGVSATREPLTTDPRSPVAHDTEADVLVAHAGRLFASTDQWEYPGPSEFGQVLVKNSRGGPWKLFERTQGLRVSVALDSFSIPSDQGLGRGHSLLITEAVLNGRPELQWLLDGAKSFSPADSFALPANVADVRSFGAHESSGVWSVYAGVDPTGILRGTWSPKKRTLVFDPTPELTAAPPGSPGEKTGKVTGFADCAGALYVSVNTRLFRRNDGRLPRGVARWVLVYQEPPVGPFNSGLRGLTCITHRGAPALLLSTEGNGDVYRLDDLPSGRLDATAAARPGDGVRGLVPILEFSPIPALRRMLAAEGTPIPATGKGSIDYVISAYNNFATVKIGGLNRQLFGIEHAYVGGCPPRLICGPTAFGAATFDAAACFAIRTDRGSSPSYALRCLSGPDFRLSVQPGKPIRAAQAFVSIRTIVRSPFGDGRLYYGGYDCNFYPADGTAWIASSVPNALHLDNK